MSSLESILDEARKLPPEEQRELAERLLAENRQPSADDEEEPIWEKIIRLMRDVPPEDWDDVPPDGSINVDHYLYGAPKRQP
jgi:hypothetical protein